MKNERSIMYKYAPQMRLYYRNTHEWKPFIMYSNKTNLRTKVVNTDNLGLRFNSINNNNHKSIFDQKNTNQEFGLIVGSSTAFGLGCTEDDQTISSKLSKLTGTLFFNLGVSAFSGFQAGHRVRLRTRRHRQGRAGSVRPSGQSTARSGRGAGQGMNSVHERHHLRQIQADRYWACLLRS